MSIYVTQSSIASWDEFVEEIKPIFKSKRMTNMGPVYKKMQQQLIRYLDVPELSPFCKWAHGIGDGNTNHGFSKGV